jgi:hypothetical protein
VEFRTLVALTATMICSAVAAHATSAVQTAREHRPAPLPATLDDPAGTVPESPLAIAGSLASDDAALQIQLGSADADPRTATLLELPFEISPH